MSEDIIGCYNWQCAISIQWGKARDADKHPIKHRAGPTTKHYLAPNVNSAEVEKPSVRQIHLSWERSILIALLGLQVCHVIEKTI